VWIVKVTVLRYGGGPLYRKTVPLFLASRWALFHIGSAVGNPRWLGKDIFKKYIVVLVRRPQLKKRHLAQHTLAALLVCVFAAALGAAEIPLTGLTSRTSARPARSSRPRHDHNRSNQVTVKDVGDFKSVRE